MCIPDCEKIEQRDVFVAVALDIQAQPGRCHRTKLRLAMGQIDLVDVSVQLVPRHRRAMAFELWLQRKIAHACMRIGEVHVNGLAPIELQLAGGVQLALGHPRSHRRIRHRLKRNHIHLLQSQRRHEMRRGKIQCATRGDITAKQLRRQIHFRGRGDQHAQALQVTVEIRQVEFVLARVGVVHGTARQRHRRNAKVCRCRFLVGLGGSRGRGERIEVAVAARTLRVVDLGLIQFQCTQVVARQQRLHID